MKKSLIAIKEKKKISITTTWENVMVERVKEMRAT